MINTAKFLPIRMTNKAICCASPYCLMEADFVVELDDKVQFVCMVHMAKMAQNMNEANIQTDKGKDVSITIDDTPEQQEPTS